MFRSRAFLIFPPCAALAAAACAAPAASAAGSGSPAVPTTHVVDSMQPLVPPTSVDEDRLAGVLFRFHTGSSVHAAPAVGADGSVYVGTGDGYVQALHPDGSLAWSFTVEGAVAWPPVLDAAEHLLVATAAQRLYSINLTGTIAWQTRPPSHVGTELVLGAHGSFLFGGTDSAIWAYSTHSTPLWHTPLGEGISGAPAVSGNRVVVGTDAGTLFFLEGAVRKHPVHLAASVRGAPTLLADGAALVVSGTDLVRVDPRGSVVPVHPRVEWFTDTASGLVVVSPGGEVTRLGADGAETHLGVLPARASAPPVDVGNGVVAAGTETGELCFLAGGAVRRVAIARAALHRPVVHAASGRVLVAAGNGMVAAVSVEPFAREGR